MAAIDAIPAADKLTLDDKAAVEKARTLYDSLNDEEKSVITNYSKLTEAEAKIRELEKQQEQKDKDKKAAEKVIADIDALPSSSELTLDPYVLQLLDRVQAEYNALTDAQKALVTNYSTLQYLRNLIPDLKAAAAVVDKIKAIGEVTSDNYLKKQALVVEARTAYDALTADQKKRVTNYAELEKAELFISRQSTDEKVAYVISFIDELNITTSSSGALSDGPLRLTEKNNNVPTEKIWNDWKAYVVNARALYDTLDDQQKAQVTNTASLEKAEGYIYQLKADALKAMLKALPDAQTVRGYEAPQRLQFHQHRRQLLLKRNRRYRHSLRDLISQMEVRTHSAVMQLMSRQLRQWISLRQKQQKLKILKMSRQMLISPLMRKFRQQVIPLSVNLQKQS